MSVSLTVQARLLLAELGWQSRPLGTIGVTSCHRREGVSTVATAMAKAAAPAGEQVLLAEVPELSDKLEDRLAHRANREEDEVDRDLVLGVATRIPGLFSLDADAMRRLAEVNGSWSGIDGVLSKARDQYELCVFDLPPILEDGRGASLAAKLDTTVLVIESGRTSVEDVRRTERVLARNGVNVSGAVLNRYRA